MRKMCMWRGQNPLARGARVTAADGCWPVKTHVRDTGKGEVGKDVVTLFVKAKR